MQGARERMRFQRSLAWWSGVLSQMQKPPSHDEFVGVEKRSRGEKVVCIKAWRELTDALRRGAGRKRSA